MRRRITERIAAVARLVCAYGLYHAVNVQRATSPPPDAGSDVPVGEHDGRIASTCESGCGTVLEAIARRAAERANAHVAPTIGLLDWCAVSLSSRSLFSSFSRPPRPKHANARARARTRPHAPARTRTHEAWRGAAAAARAEMLAVIESVPVFGADLASGLDSPAAPSRPNRAVESGLATLPELRSYLWTKRSVGHVFDVQRAEPRFGPSRPDAEQRFECLWPQDAPPPRASNSSLEGDTGFEWAHL